ncbi:MAG: leucine-rich repeat protein [Clostridia bacterium]|nr:leucine-rich repeat protein [Clostridia bacterium]
MKKKLLLTLLVVMTLVCLFTVAVSAEDKIVSSTNNAYGELTTFDEAIGNTSISNLKDDGTIARTVLTDGNGNYYTIPTVYTLTESYKNQSGKVGEMFLLSFDEISAKLGFTVSKNSIIRIEFPSDIAFICRNNENLSGSANVIEIIVNDGLRFWENSNQMKAFTNCKSLETIDLSGMIIEYSDATYALFENCSSLVSVKLPNAYESNGTPVKYNLNYMFGGCSNLETVENFGNLTKGVTSYDQNLFYNCNKLYNVTGLITNGIMVVPSNVTYYGNYAFQNCDRIRAIKFTSSSTKMLQSVFHSLDALEFVSFPRDSKLELPSCEVFSNNEKLKAVAFPDDCTLIPDRGFKNCKGLYAVYLPANLYELKTNGGGQGAFAYNDDMYFVNDYFSVLDENGEFLFDKFQMPERPDVYYFPSTLTLLYKRDGGTGFDGNYNLNPVMVLPETVTELWIYDGCFYNCGTTDNQKTIVMLGDMVNVRFNMRDSRTVGINYVFANPLDQDLTSVNIVDTTDRTCYNVTNETIYFCSTGKTYALSQWEAHPDPATFEFTTENKHLCDPKKNADKDATCTSAAGSFTYCFCGKEISFVADEGSVALGHIYDDSNIVEKILPTLENGKVDFYSDSTYVYACPQCSTDVSRVEVGTSFFTKSGYSSNEEDKANVVFVIVANYKNIQQYVGENDAEIAYGVVVSANTTGTPLSYVDGQVKEGANTVKVDMTNTSYSKMTVKVTKVGDLSLHCCGYISFNGEISYLNHATVDDTALEVSLSIIDSILNPQVTPPVEEDPSEEIPVE